MKFTSLQSTESAQSYSSKETEMDEQTLEKAHQKMDDIKQAQAFYKHLHVATIDLEPAQLFTAEEVRQFIAHEYNRFAKA